MRQNKYLLYIMALVFLLLIIIVVLWNENSLFQRDTSILNQSACQFPCWHNVVPGVTSLADARAILAANDYLHNYSEFTPSFNLQRTDIVWDTGDRLTFSDGILQSIHIVNSVPFTINDILTLYGNPNGAKISYSSRGSTYTILILLSLYYPNFGMVTSFEVYKGDGRLTDRFALNRELRGTEYRLAPSGQELTDLLSRPGIEVSGGSVYIGEFVELDIQQLEQYFVKLSHGTMGEIFLEIETTPPPT